jgi:hypothetical protein
MPALVHLSPSRYIASNSPSIFGAKVALLEQTESQQPNGLVNVAVSYGIETNSSSAIPNIFYLDAPPPLFPSCVQRDSLQQRNLFLLDFTTQKQNGLWTVDANYVGARTFVSGRQRPFVTRDNESRVTPAIRITAGYDITAEDPPRQIVQYDTVIVRFVAQVITAEIAAVGAGLFDREGSANASGLIYRIEYGNLERSNPDVRTRTSLPSPKSLLDRFEPSVEISTSITNITNTVIVAKTTRNVVFNPLALDEAVLI